jgi:hypothetical protein
VEDDPENPEQTEQAVPADKSKKFQIRVVGAAIIHALGRLLPRLGLYFFMLAAPLAIVGYPAYKVAERLADYSTANTLEAGFAGMEINKVKDLDNKSAWFKSKGHIDVLLSFKAKDGKTYISVLKKPWTSPGLKGKMEEQYQEGEIYTLYQTGDGGVHAEEDVAKDNFFMLTLLMGLVFIAYVLFVLIRKRLSTQQPEMVHLASSATAKSIIAAQSVALLVAAVLTGVVAYQPIFIPNLLYLGCYWGAVVFLAISLRLLVFQPVHPEPVAKEQAEPEKPRAQRP